MIKQKSQTSTKIAEYKTLVRQLRKLRDKAIAYQSSLDAINVNYCPF